MMLLALMRRSPRRVKTSQGKRPASLVRLADARACRPSLLLMVVRVLIMSVTAVLVLRGADGHPHDPLRATPHNPRHHPTHTPTPAPRRERRPSTRRCAMLQGVAPNRSVSTSVLSAPSWSSMMRAWASDSSGGWWGSMSNAATLSAQSANTCSAHARKACASGAWAMMRMLVVLMGRGFAAHYGAGPETETRRRPPRCTPSTVPSPPEKPPWCWPPRSLRSLPPEGVVFRLGAARRRNLWPPRSLRSLPPEGVAFRLGAARRRNLWPPRQQTHPPPGRCPIAP